MNFKRFKKILSVTLSVLLVMSAMLCGTVVATDAAYSVGDYFYYQYVVQCDSLIMGFQGEVAYPADQVSVPDDSYITVYDGTTGSAYGHDVGDGIIKFNGTDTTQVYDFTEGTAIISVLFEVIADDFDPESIDTTLSFFYEDSYYIDNGDGTTTTITDNVAFGYKNVVDDEVINGGNVDIEAGTKETTEATESTSTEAQIPTDEIYLDYSNSSHSLSTWDTPFTNNNDGTYSCSMEFSGSTTNCALYNYTTSSYYSLSSMTAVNLASVTSGTYSLTSSSTRKALVFTGSSVEGTLVFTYDYNSKTLSFELTESPTDPSETTEPTEPEPTEKDFTVIYNYVTKDETTQEEVERTLTKTVTADSDTDAETLANEKYPSIKNPYYSYMLGQCEFDENDDSIVIADLDATPIYYTVSLDGETVYDDCTYKQEVTVEINGADYTFFVTGDVELTSDTPTETEDAVISLDSVTITDEQITLELLATANSDDFARMGVAFATSEKTQEELAAAVTAIETGTDVYDNSIVVHNSTVDSPNVSGQYQFIYAPYLSKENAVTTLYFYTYVVDSQGNVSVSTVVSFDLENAYA